MADTLFDETTTPAAPTDTQVTPDASAAPEPTPQVAGAAEPSSPAASPAPAAPVAPVAPVVPSWLSGLKEAGIDHQFTDEKAALAAIANTIKQHQQVAPYAQYLPQYIQNAQAFAKWQADQQKAKPAAAAEDGPWYKEFWNPPEYDQRWENMIQVDPTTGAITAKPGVPPDVALKYQQYRAFRQEAAEKLMQNIPGYLEPMIDKRVEMLVEKRLSATLQSRDTAAASQQLIESNSSWLYQKDASGNIAYQQVFNQATGQMQQVPIENEWGKMMTYYAGQAKNMGINTPNDRWNYALACTQNQRMSTMLQQQQAGTPPVNPGAPATPAAPAAPPLSPREQSNKDFLDRANGTVPQKGQSVPALDTTSKGKPSFAAMMREEMAGSGS